MDYEINKGERTLAAWLINNLPGVNRTDARLLTKVYEHLKLNEVQGTVSLVEAEDIHEEVELAELEVSWILDRINKAFGEQEVPPALSRYALSLEDKLKESLV